MDFVFMNFYRWSEIKNRFIAFDDDGSQWTTLTIPVYFFLLLIITISFDAQREPAVLSCV